MEPISKKKVEYLVVDTSAFIKNAPLQDIGENILTVQDVVNEITSKRQLRRLVVLPYDLKVKDTFPEHVKFVTEFSKKTGDYLCLSATDIQVIALTYQLEKEKVGIEHLKEVPLHKPGINITDNPPIEFKDVVGFFAPKNQEVPADGNAQTKVFKEDSDDSFYETASENDEGSDYEDTEENVIEQNPEDPEHVHVDSLLRRVESDDEEERSDYDEDDESYDDEDDESAWITPDNIGHVKKHVNAEIEEECPVVACLTTDFAMQNVLKQIGLKVVTLEGRLIKQLRTYILRCYACFKTTSIMTKVFCPNCGNKTLKRVAVTLNPDGTQEIHINSRRPLTARGKKFSLPKPQGGKHAKNPILCEDQPLPQQRPSKLTRTQNNPLDPDYIAGYSPFIMRDVNSKSAMLGLRNQGEIKHWMKRNPNEAKHRSRRKKK